MEYLRLLKKRHIAELNAIKEVAEATADLNPLFPCRTKLEARMVLTLAIFAGVGVVFQIAILAYTLLK